ncbi:isoprenylcysteine carboxyl methyltransferase [Colletotrichum orchidophilum]|uniref:Protein-S-isoprenylcysteine O-methyltransferase n=1 Tax=Colletotrichum orchidophilum TaxID=1209926 RepID=A0A1G4BAB1_9PEZI|nr:isoprenylcysteine carboxyl methyltransferase [Colletotrichum orchidophilum]OHE98344.1 isoprenylcysteine carboxyl methyltransferase [Colletotrichum orchidophilum]
MSLILLVAFLTSTFSHLTSQIQHNASRMSVFQASLSVAILASTVGTYLGLLNPNPKPPQQPGDPDERHHHHHQKQAPPQQHADSIRWMLLTHKHTPKFVLLPLALLSLHLAALSYYHPHIPPSVLGHGAQNGLSASLTTWSASTLLPLSAIFLAGVPLRLGPYRSLGKNFTFHLTKPDQLKTTGIYSRVQHPSYTGVVVLVLSNVALLARLDGVLSCWVAPGWHEGLRAVQWVLGPVACCVFLLGVWTRVREEERMLRAEFGEKWERWHASTARFIPHVF